MKEKAQSNDGGTKLEDISLMIVSNNQDESKSREDVFQDLIVL